MGGWKVGVWMMAAAIATIAGAPPAWATEGRARCRADAGSRRTISHGLDVSLERGADGRAVVLAHGHGLDVRKVVAPDGTFSLTLAMPGDIVTIAGGTGALSVTRGDTRADVPLGKDDAASEATAARLLAGSPAVRTFRAAVAAGGPALRSGAAGAALQMADVMLRILQDDPSAIERLRPTGGTGGTVFVSRAEPRPCFSEWETEVLSAWDWYEGCYWDFSWWSGGRMGCAFLYLIRVEAAWFQFLTCVGFKA